jgi:pimeloyl-ACP methyl ester carboxylesterase
MRAPIHINTNENQKIMYQKFQLSKPIEGNVAFVKMPDDTSIHTITSGSGKTTILLAHGYGFSHLEWNIIVERLNQLNYRTIVFDQRGHGKSTIGKEGISSSSMASDYKNLIEYFNLENCILVGHSMGGFLTMKFLLDNPDMQHKSIKSCVLMATFAGDINKNNFQNRLQIPLIKSGILLKLIKWNPIGHLFGKSLIGENPDPELIRAILEVFLQQDHSKLVPILKAFADESYYDRLKNITIPCAVVIGSKDATTPPFHTDSLVKEIPNSTRIDIKGKGHCLNAEAPDEIINAIKLIDK